MTKNISLPTLRRICGFTQAALAKKIGVSTPTIVAIENGKRTLSGENARKIMYATGVLKDSLIEDDFPRALDGQSYSKAHWDIWRSMTAPTNTENLSWGYFLEETLRLKFDSLLEVASESGRIFLVAEEFRIMLVNLFKDPCIKRLYLESKNEDPEGFESWIEAILYLAAEELGAKGNQDNLSKQPFGQVIPTDSPDPD